MIHTLHLVHTYDTYLICVYNVLQEHRRPRIDTLIDNPSLTKHMSKGERRASSSDSGSSLESNESLKKREDIIKAKEKMLQSRERELDCK